MLNKTNTICHGNLKRTVFTSGKYSNCVLQYGDVDVRKCWHAIPMSPATNKRPYVCDNRQCNHSNRVYMIFMQTLIRRNVGSGRLNGFF